MDLGMIIEKSNPFLAEIQIEAQYGSQPSGVKLGPAPADFLVAKFNLTPSLRHVS